jgi:hypothetical protein
MGRLCNFDEYIRATLLQKHVGDYRLGYGPAQTPTPDETLVDNMKSNSNYKGVQDFHKIHADLQPASQLNGQPMGSTQSDVFEKYGAVIQASVKDIRAKNGGDLPPDRAADLTKAQSMAENVVGARMLENSPHFIWEVGKEFQGKGIDVVQRTATKGNFKFQTVNVFSSLLSPKTTTSDIEQQNFKKFVREFQNQPRLTPDKLRNTAVRKAILITNAREMNTNINYC